MADDENDDQFSAGNNSVGIDVMKDHSGKSGYNLKRPHDEGEMSTKKHPRLSNSELYQPPSAEEMIQLKETENLFQSSLFRMQITEILKEVTLSENERKVIDSYITDLKEVLLHLPSGKLHDLSAESWPYKKVKLPIIQQPSFTKGRYKFKAPCEVHLIGSYAMRTCIKPEVQVDLALQIPKECMQSKDFVNHRYLRKRASFLAFVAKELRKNSLVEDVKFTYHHGNMMRPVVILTPSVATDLAFTVNLHTTVEKGTFKMSRFHVCKNNIRRAWYYEQDESKETDENEEECDKKNVATPHYNTAILMDLGCVQHASTTLFDENKGLREGLALLHIWLRQRQLDKGCGVLSGFVMAMFVIHLFKKRSLNIMMSSYQVFRNTILHLSQIQWAEKGISMLNKSDLDANKPNLDDFHHAFNVVFVDETGYINLCAEMNIGTFQRIRHEAKLGFKLLEDTSSNHFDLLFLNQSQFSHKFDSLFFLSGLRNIDNITKVDLSQEIMDHGGSKLQATIPTLVDLLSNAIGRRVHLACIKPISSVMWKVNEKPPNLDQEDQLCFGLLLNSDTAFSLLDKGPAADVHEAAAFRKFWGEKSELRRFQDGSICEAVVWPGSSISDRRGAIRHIVRYVLQRHTNIPKNSVHFTGRQLTNVLHRTSLSGTGEEEHAAVLSTYDSLCHEIRAMKDLPLAISTIQGISPVFRYSETYPPLPEKRISHGHSNEIQLLPHPQNICPSFTLGADVMCILEGSGKWPEDKDAVQRLKAAFHIRLSKHLVSRGLCCTAHTKHVKVLKDGYIFKIIIGYMHEIVLQKMVKTNEGMIRMEKTDISQNLELNLQVLPKLTSAIHGLQQQYNSLSGAVRLAKRWLSSQLLLDYYLSEPAVELLMASIYVAPSQYTAPSSPQVAFLRFLSLLSTHDWTTSPLIINLNDELQSEDFAEIYNHFNKKRSSLPLMYLATPYDKLTSRWTRLQPCAPVLQRLSVLSRESLKVLEAQLQEPKPSDFKVIFRPPLDVFDVLINLNRSHLPRKNLMIDTDEESTGKISKKAVVINDVMPVVNYDPVKCYLKDLRDTYDDMALFFHDTYGGDVVAVLWKPHAFKSKPFKAMDIRGHLLEKSSHGVHMVPNVQAILEDFHTIGHGLVSGVESKTERWKI